MLSIPPQPPKSWSEACLVPLKLQSMSCGDSESTCSLGDISTPTTSDWHSQASEDDPVQSIIQDFRSGMARDSYVACIVSYYIDVLGQNVQEPLRRRYVPDDGPGALRDPPARSVHRAHAPEEEAAAPCIGRSARGVVDAHGAGPSDMEAVRLLLGDLERRLVQEQWSGQKGKRMQAALALLCRGHRALERCGG